MNISAHLLFFWEGWALVFSKAEKSPLLNIPGLYALFLSLGHSNNPVTHLAVEDIVSQCRKNLAAGLSPALGLVFTSCMDADFQFILARIKREWPDILLTGCTTDGEISGIFPYTEDSISLLLIHSENISFSAGLGENLSLDPENAVRAAADQAKQQLKEDPSLCLVLADGLETFGISLDKELSRVLGVDLPVFGGLAGDHYQFQQTFQFYDTRVVSDALVLIMLSGPVCFSMSLKTGWKPIGRTFEVTAYSGNVIREIANIPALDFFRKYLGNNTSEYSQFPLAVLMEDDGFILRDPVFFNQEDGSVSFVGTFSEKPRVRLTEFSRDGLIKASDQALTQALSEYPGQYPSLALVFPCTSRRHILGSRAVREHRILMEMQSNNPGFRFFGMYAYGELGPVTGSGRTRFHNDTYAVLFMGESS